jgi:hypothetical protein
MREARDRLTDIDEQGAKNPHSRDKFFPARRTEPKALEKRSEMRGIVVPMVPDFAFVSSGLRWVGE